MGQKDSSEKLLEDYSDVFADIVNVLLFHGERIVKEEDLQETGLNSQYKADDGKLHEQERDVARYWKRGNVKIALCGLENQTGVDNDMPLRIMNYDGASITDMFFPPWFFLHPISRLTEHRANTVKAPDV